MKPEPVMESPPVSVMLPFKVAVDVEVSVAADVVTVGTDDERVTVTVYVRVKTVELPAGVILTTMGIGFAPTERRIGADSVLVALDTPFMVSVAFGLATVGMKAMLDTP